MYISNAVLCVCVYIIPSSPDRAALGLEERLEYMSRAVMCAKSCNMATAASRVGELLHELEEKMEVGEGRGGEGRRGEGRRGGGRCVCV